MVLLWCFLIWLLTGIIYHRLSSYCWTDLQSENNYWCILQCVLQLYLFELFFYLTFVALQEISSKGSVENRWRKLLTGCRSAAERLQRSLLPANTHTFSIIIVHILFPPLLSFPSLIVDLPFWIPYPSPSTSSMLWNFCIHLSILLLTGFFHQCLLSKRAGLLGQEGNGASCCVHPCIILSGKNSEHRWWERKDGLMVGLSLEEIMMCGDFQQEFLQLYEVHRESFRLEKTCKIIESNHRFKDNECITNIKDSVRKRKIQ